MSEAQVRAKFRGNAGLALGVAEIEAVEEGVLALEEQDDVGGLLSLVTAAKVTV